ncbi:MAG TPA: hypothetical protein VGY66_08055, partial [Gemmataceae bacterium]|nr:hypothetical protein [Gemmataceae bacterium]
MRKFMLLMLLPLSVPPNGYGDQPSDDQTVPIILKMEDSKASRRGKLQLTEEDLKDPQKLSARLLKGWPKEDLFKRGVLEVDGHKYSLYL